MGGGFGSQGGDGVEMVIQGEEAEEGEGSEDEVGGGRGGRGMKRVGGREGVGEGGDVALVAVPGVWTGVGDAECVWDRVGRWRVD